MAAVVATNGRTSKSRPATDSPGTETEPAPGPSPSQSATARYTEARARKTLAQAQLAEIQLAENRRQLIPKEEIAIEFGRIARILLGRLRRAANDMPCALVGLTESQIDKWAQDMIVSVTADLRIDERLYERKRV